MDIPKNKADYYTRWQRGEFGNKLRTFDNVDDLLKSEYKGKVSIRYKIPSAPYCKYEVPIDKVLPCLQTFRSEGAQLSLFTFNESAPDSDLTMQGEFIRMVTGWELYYSLLPTQMRKALAQDGKQVTGLRALQTVKHFTNENGFDMLMDLFDKYDTDPQDNQGMAIEFSCYNRHLGMMPGHNTIIWEVRKY